MSMSTHVVGFRPPDDRWKQMKAVYDACAAASIDPPDEVIEFFNDVEPDPAGVVVGIMTRPYKTDSSEGFEIDLSEIPDYVKIVRLYNSW